MSRPRRVHLPEGIYYVSHRGSKYGSLFLEADDYVLIEDLLSSMLKHTGALLHAYCWTSDAIHLVLQIPNGSVSRFVQTLASCYARRMNHRLGGRGHFFSDRHRQILIDTENYLPALINYVHYIPVLEDAAPSVDGYQHTSHQAYLGRRDVPWLHTHTALRLMDGSDDGCAGYRNLMSKPPTSEIVSLFQGTAGVVGNAVFLGNLQRESRLPRRYRNKISLEEICANVACLRGLRRELILSRSRVREHALARAMITWYATERGVASLTEVASYLGRDPSTLSTAVHRYRTRRPDLFTLTMFQSLMPIGGELFPMRAKAFGGSDDISGVSMSEPAY